MKDESIWSIKNRKLIDLYIKLALAGNIILGYLCSILINYHSAIAFVSVFIPQIILWYCIYKKDKNYNTAALAFLFQMALNLPEIYPPEISPFSNLLDQNSPYYFIVWLTLQFSCFYLYSKFTYPSKNRHWPLAIFGILYTSAIVSYCSLISSYTLWDFYELISGRYFNGNMLTIEVLGHLNFFDFFATTGLNFILFLTFLKFRQIVTSEQKFKLKLTTIFETTPIPKLSFTLYFLLLRSILLISVFKIITIQNWNLLDLPLSSLIDVLIILIGIYILTSIYRNFVILYTQQRGYHSKWFYFGLQIPFIGLIFLIILLVRASKKSSIQNIAYTIDVIDNEEIIDLETNPERHIKTIESTQVIQRIFLLLLLISYLYTSLFESPILYPDERLYLFIILSTATFLYIYKEFGIFAFIGLQIALLIQCYLDPSLLPFSLLSYISVVKLVVNYPIFHFDQFTFVSYLDKEDENHESNIEL